MFLKSTVARPGLTLAAVAVVQFMVSLDLSVVNVGLPEIASGLGFSAVNLAWVIHAYALTFGGLLLLGGKASDRYGRRRMLLLGLALFGLASLGGGFAQQPAHLIAARAVQGVGAATLAPAALALLTATFPSGRERVRAFGIWSATNAAGGAIGVLIGGLLTQYVSWRAVMFVNVPMVAIAALMVARIHDGRTMQPGQPGQPVQPGQSGQSVQPGRRGGRPDVVGGLLATAGMTTLVFGVVRTDRHPWSSATTLLTLAIAVVLLAGFVYVERTTRREPLLRLGLLANRSVSGANGFNLLMGATIASSFYFMSLYLQEVLHHGPAASGLMFLPFALALVGGSFLAIKLGYRFATRDLLVGGALLVAAGFGWFSLISVDGSFLVNILGPSILVGTGFGLCLAPLVSTATGGVAPEEAGTASGLLNSSRQIGASLGLAALGTVAHDRTGDLGTVGALNAGYALALRWCAVLLLAGVVIVLAVLRRTPPRSTAAVRAAVSESA